MTTTLQKTFLALGMAVFLSSCSVNYPVTNFYVKNTSSNTVNFNATIIKFSSMGSMPMTVSFRVLPNDSTLARQVGFKNGALPNNWFTQFNIFPIDGVQFNDPNDSTNWKKSMDSKGRPTYTFNLTK